MTTTRWRWATLSPEITLTLTLDSDDPELIERVEHSARENRITLIRLDPPEVPELPKPLPDDYWETAQ